MVQILDAPINDFDKFARSDCTWQRVLPSGIVLPFGGASPPAGWLLADGTSYPTATYPDLFAVLGYTYGGSGANFNVPDMRGRTVVGAGAGAGLTNRPLGGTVGEESHALTIPELASHTHDLWHTHTMGNHTHLGVDHLHSLQGHTHGMDHYHLLANHTHAGVDHLHGMSNHTHGPSNGQPINWAGGTFTAGSVQY